MKTVIRRYPKFYPKPTPIARCDSANQEREAPSEPRTIVNHVSEPEISNVSQEVNQNELLRFKGRIGGHDAVILIDSGSTHYLISTEFIQKYRIDTRNLEGLFEGDYGGWAYLFDSAIMH